MYAKGIINEVNYLITSQVLWKELLITINLFGFFPFGFVSNPAMVFFS